MNKTIDKYDILLINSCFEEVSAEVGTSMEERMKVYNGFLFLTNLQTFDPNITVNYFWDFHWEIVMSCNMYLCFLDLENIYFIFKNEIKGKSPEVPFYGITSPYSYFEVI